MKKQNSIAILSFVILLMLCFGVANAGTESVTDNGLFFGLGQDTVFISTTTGDTTLEQAKINFTMTFGVNDVQVPSGDLTMMSFELIFDSGDLSFYRANAAGSWTVDTTTLEPGRLWVQIYGDAVQPPDDNPTAVVELVFLAECQAEKSVDDINFDRARCYAVVGGVPYVPNVTGEDNWEDGAVTLPDYEATFSIDTLSATAAYNTTVSVPVRLRSNFRIAVAQQVITFDTTRLQYVSCVYSDFLAGNRQLSANRTLDTIVVFENMPYNPLPTTDSNAVLYWLNFEVDSTIKWDGDITELVFDDSRCGLLPSYNPYYCTAVLQDDPPYGLVDGGVFLERYEATFRAVPTNDTAYAGDTVVVPYTLQLKNSFYTGMPTSSGDYFGNIALSLLSLYNTTFNSISDFDEDLYFFPLSDPPHYSIDERWASSPATNIWAPHQDFGDLMQLSITCYNLPDPASWENRFFVPFTFENSAPAFSRDTRVVDYYGVITADSTNGRLSWEVEPIEIAMGEWLGEDGSCEVAPQVLAAVKIRHNVDLSYFRVQVSTGTEFEITSVATADDVSSQTVQCGAGYSCRLIESDPEAVFPATGDDWRTIATVHYQLVPGCTESATVGGSVTFSNRLVIDTEDDTVYAIGNASASLSAVCWERLMEGGEGLIPDQAEAFSLRSNYPNPFNPSTQIGFDLGAPCHVTLEVFNITGQRVASLADRRFETGSHVVEWDGKNSAGSHVASGVYLYRLKAGDYVATRKMVLLR